MSLTSIVTNTAMSTMRVAWRAPGGRGGVNTLIKIFGRGVRKHTDVGPGSLGVLEVLRPRADILVVGSGQNTVRPSEALRDYARAQGCALEVQATAAAVSTYNVLSQEGRRVVAVLLPEDAESGPSGFGSYFPI